MMDTDGQLNVLVVEDNPGDIHLIEEGFQQSDVDSSTTVVNDGEAALEYLRQRDGTGPETKLDLVLLDLNVPKKNGEVVLETIKSDGTHESIPVLVLSGSGAENHIAETHEMGADGYFVKPVDPNEFITLVADIVTKIANSGRLLSGEYDSI